jgi:hypothetical protein
MTDDRKIICEWRNSVGVYPSQNQCTNEAKYVIILRNGHPILLPFRDYNFVCEIHLKAIKSRKNAKDYTVFELMPYEEKVQFT